MTYPVIFTRRADCQAEKIYKYIEKRAGSRIATRYVEDLFAFCYQLGNSPSAVT